MREMLVTEFERYIRDEENDGGKRCFRYDQRLQPDAADLARVQMTMTFDRVYVTPCPPALHLVNDCGTMTIGDVKCVRLGSKSDASRFGWRSSQLLTVVCRNDEMFRFTINECALKKG